MFASVAGEKVVRGVPMRLDQVDTGALVARLGVLRREATLVREQLRPGTVPAEMLGSLVEAIDRNAFLITGRPVLDAVA